MSWQRRLGEQLARPEGSAGRLLGMAMDLANRRPLALAVDLLAPRATDRVLDIGCGTGAAAQRILKRVPCRITCADRSPTMLAVARRRLAGIRREMSADFALAELGALPFAEGSYDATLALNLLYFCDAEGRMLADLKRVLRPGGRLVAYVTHRDSMASWSFVHHGTHRLFDADELAGALVAGGFDPEGIELREHRITGKVRGLLARATA
jgi:ubiquinone/menaquinone biosynthesis C-methylase UbiE